MNSLQNEDLIKILKTALFDKKLKSIDFKILSYIAYNSDFLIKNMKEDLNISSFNTLSSSIKNLIKNDYILKENNHLKNRKNVSTYQLLINTKKSLLLKFDSSSIDSPYFEENLIYEYFFQKISTKSKIDKFSQIKAIQLLNEIEKINFNLLKKVIDFISSREDLKKKINRPTLLRKNIKEILSIYHLEKKEK